MPPGAGGRPPAAHADAEDIARAWELYHLEGLSVRKVAGQLGISVGTAHNWISTAREALPWVEAMNRATMRDGQAGRLMTYLSWCMDQQRTGRDPLEVIETALKVEKRLADLLGLDAPGRLQLEDGRAPQPTVRPDVLAAIAEVDRRAAAERRAAGGPPALPAAGGAS